MSVFITDGFGHIASRAVYCLTTKSRQELVYDINSNPPEYLNEVYDRIISFNGDVLDTKRWYYTLNKYRHNIDGIIHSA
jgi:UDP-glucose 4-epimerase